MSFLSGITLSPNEYVENAFLAKETGDELVSRLEWLKLSPKIIANVGAGPGFINQALAARYPHAKLVSVDADAKMLEYAQKTMPSSNYMCANAQSLSLDAGSVDLLIAHFLIPWQSNLPELLKEWFRVLAPGGVLMLTGLGPDTLKELSPYLKVDQLPCRIDMHDIGDQLIQQGFSDPVLDVCQYSVSYRSKSKLEKELIGSKMISTLPSALAKFNPEADGKWHLTYEVVFGHTFKPSESNLAELQEDGHVRIPLNHLRRQLRGSIK